MFHIMSRRRLMLACVLSTILEVCSAIAQVPDAKPKEFYEPNFVTKTNPRPNNLPESDARGVSGLGQQHPGASLLPRQLPVESSEPSAAPTASPRYKTYKVKAISAVFNSMDKNHFESVLKELIDVAQHFDFAIDNVYVPGSLDTLGQAASLFVPLVARGGTISFANVPIRWQVKMSPTWVIETADGEFVMEATGPLAENFDENGQFVDIPRKVTEITPVPTPTPENAESKLQELGKTAEGAAPENAPSP